MIASIILVKLFTIPVHTSSVELVTVESESESLFSFEEESEELDSSTLVVFPTFVLGWLGASAICD